ncbi:MAG: hypothetical protein ACM3YN_13140 [Parcubacteria group bacterium]
MRVTRRSVLGGAAALGATAPALAATGIDPRAFGARFDGVTDDTAAWQAAVDRAIQTGQPVVARGGVSRLVCRPDPLTTYGNTTARLYRAVDIRGSNLTLIGEGAEIRLVGFGRQNAVNYAFATKKNLRPGALSNIRVRGMKFDFDPTGDPSINKRSFHLVGVRGVEISDVSMRSSGVRAGATITLQNCSGVRMSRLRFSNTTQGMNLSYVDDVVGDDWSFDNFSEAVDFDRMVSGFKLTNLRFRGRDGRCQCLDLNSCSDGLVSGVQVDTVGNIATVNFKTTTPPTYSEYVSNPHFVGPPFQPSRNVTIEHVSGSRIGTQRSPAFVLGGEARLAAQNASPNRGVTLRDIHLTACTGAILIEQTAGFTLDDVTLDGVAPPAAGFGAIDIRSRRPGSQVSGALRNVKLRFKGAAGAGVRAAGPSRLSLENVEVTGPASAAVSHFDFANLDMNDADLSVSGAVARSSGGGGGPAFRFSDNGKGGYRVNWGAGNRHIGAFGPQAVVRTGRSRQMVPAD